MKKTILTVAAAIIAPLSAFAADSCDATYVTGEGESLKSIVAKAYAAPMLSIVHARNPHIDGGGQLLESGAEVYLPCLHNLPQLTPRLSDKNGQGMFKVAQHG